MKITLDLRKSIPENAQEYYEGAKKAKRKIPGLVEALERSGRELEELSLSGAAEVETQVLEKRRARAWFEKFRWFYSSEGFLVIGGRDATTNDILVKKHLEADDVVFHADIQGAPFFIVKNPDGVEVPENTLREAAAAAASYSRAWKNGWASCNVYYVSPEQVSKSPPAGEYLPKGAFMIYGEKKWFKNTPVEVAVGFQDVEPHVIGGPKSAVKVRAIAYSVVVPGDEKAGVLSKRIAKAFKEKGCEEFSLNDIQYFIPGGEGKLS
ncbi:MAG TPA: DUF814 domain-containing protein [Candidatus Altiarchaeales archaeon]|nr:DUF814 domain-containing protein [Candidatus Altiarchaeales archaeon]